MLERHVLALTAGSDVPPAKNVKHKDTNPLSKPQALPSPKNVAGSRLKSSALRQTRTSSLLANAKQAKVDFQCTLDAPEAPNNVSSPYSSSENSSVVSKETMSDPEDVEFQLRKFGSAPDINQTLRQTFLFCETQTPAGLTISGNITDTNTPIISLPENTTDPKEIISVTDFNHSHLNGVVDKDVAIVRRYEDSKDSTGTRIGANLIYKVIRDSRNDDDPNFVCNTFKSSITTPCGDPSELPKSNAIATSLLAKTPPGNTESEVNGSNDDDKVTAYQSLPDVALASLIANMRSTKND
ncbi:hypothetical protein O6H91_01G083900 [Diphasiastrum complanatum]|uniref:Uncharacterized protein n=3 Tax=Diphasiastrum complanatum TaxID=34168 RepID=A0ACC2ESQ8_DIPCM|nr:hypothetical protein O6H91_01G083900 [Diphasiastrum complanatum]